MSFTADDILDYLEESTSEREVYRFFIDLENGYFLNATALLHLYADAGRWAMTFETTGYHNRARRVMTDLFHYGNCLIDLPRGGADDRYECNMQNIEVLDCPSIESDFELVPLSIDSVRIRDRDVRIPGNAEPFLELGLEVKGGYISPTTLVRYVAAHDPSPFLATSAELREHVPADLPHLLTLREWHHRSYSNYGAVAGDRLRSYETYPMLARVLVARDPSLYRPSLPANTHWSNWPDAGGL